MSDMVPAALANMLEPLVQIERLENWAHHVSQRFFEMSHYAAGEWEVTLYLDDESSRRFDPEEMRLSKSISARGVTLSAAIVAVLDKFEAGEA